MNKIIKKLKKWNEQHQCEHTYSNTIRRVCSDLFDIDRRDFPYLIFCRRQEKCTKCGKIFYVDVAKLYGKNAQVHLANKEFVKSMGYEKYE